MAVCSSFWQIRSKVRERIDVCRTSVCSRAFLIFPALTRPDADVVQTLFNVTRDPALTAADVQMVHSSEVFLFIEMVGTETLEMCFELSVAVRLVCVACSCCGCGTRRG